jgi:hypothetical protein
VLEDAAPLLAQLDPAAAQLDPSSTSSALYKRELTAFFANTVGATQAATSSRACTTCARRTR